MKNVVLAHHMSASWPLLNGSSYFALRYGYLQQLYNKSIVFAMSVNRINLELLNLIPLEGVDINILCSGCAAACCQKDVVMPLTPDEISFLEERGTALEELSVAQRSFGRRIVDHFIAPHKAVGDQKLMKLTEDCGNLGVDSETGRQVCEAYYDNRRPQICSDFKMGSYACGLLQLRRLKRD